MNNPKDIDFRLSLDETLIIKGIAICLMLWHHLFYKLPEYGNLVFQTAQFGKVCVSLFLFVSAYGLTVQYGKTCNKPIIETFKFQAKRLVKFYVNYWVIFLIFVPIAVFVFGRTLQDVYGASNPIKSVFIDFLGLKGYRSYDSTWWFNLQIITMYLLFPLLYFFAKKHSILLLIASAVLWFIYLPLLPFDVHEYVFHFILGIVFALKIDKINSFLNSYDFWLLTVFLLLFFCILYYLRIFPVFITHLDGIIALNMILIVMLIIRKIQLHTGVLRFLGKHSINIYMTHSFIYGIFFREAIYSFKYPILIFIVLMFICLIISVLIEYGKKIVSLSSLIKIINNKIDNQC